MAIVLMIENNRDDTSEAWVLSVEGNDKPVDAEFLPLDEEHTCRWNFAEGGRDLEGNTFLLMIQKTDA